MFVLIPAKFKKRKIEFAENIIFSLNNDDRLEYGLLYYLLQNSFSRDDNGQRTELYFEMLLNIMCTFSLDKKHSDKKWSKLMVYISDNFVSPKVEKAAQVCNLSVRYFSRQFKKTT